MEGRITMEWIESTKPEWEIKDIHATIKDSELTLTWFWPKEIDFVYISFMDPDTDAFGKMKLYTRDEYKAKQSYIGRIDSIGKYEVRIFPCVKDLDHLFVIKQVNNQHHVYVNTGKARIYYSILYKQKWFGSRKKIRMKIMAEVPFGRDILCYVKKQGGVPISLDDGTFYPFVRDFPAGNTELPEIELDKDEYIRIFFHDGKKFAEMYELIPN
jgi:hypothetical protein